MHSALALQVEELTPAGSALTLLSVRTKVGSCADIRNKVRRSIRNLAAPQH